LELEAKLPRNLDSDKTNKKLTLILRTNSINICNVVDEECKRCSFTPLSRFVLHLAICLAKLDHLQAFVESRFCDSFTSLQIFHWISSCFFFSWSKKHKLFYINFYEKFNVWIAQTSTNMDTISTMFSYFFTFLAGDIKNLISVYQNQCLIFTRYLWT